MLSLRQKKWPFILGSYAMITGLSTPTVQAQDLTELAKQIQTGQNSATQLLQNVQQRSGQLNPRLHAVSALNSAAMDEAKRSDQQRDPSLPLQGISIMVKDNIAVKAMATTAGSLALLDNIAEHDAFIVAKLRAAGLIVAGKTNLSEWANFRSTHSSSGWSSVGGQTRNPYDLRKSPCGSSSGSGAAVAARLIPAAIGTETDGSIVCPASVNGLVGLKPTLGLVSRSGIIPLSHSQDTAGPMTLTVRDAALLLNVIAGSDPDDSASLGADQNRSADYTAGLDPQALKGKRLGVVKNLSEGYDRATRLLFRRSIELLKAQGAEVIEDLAIPHLEALEKDEFPVLLYDFKADLNTYLAQAPAKLKSRSLADLIQFNLQHAPQVMPYFKQELMEQAQAKGPLTDAEYLQPAARAKQLAGPDGIDALMKSHHLDALIAPTTGPAWAIDYRKGDIIAGSASTPAAIAGYPHLSVPMGLVRGLPVGLSFFAGAWSDASLLNMGYAFEQARAPLPAPKMEADKPAARHVKSKKNHSL